MRTGMCKVCDAQHVKQMIRVAESMHRLSGLSTLQTVSRRLALLTADVCGRAGAVTVGGRICRVPADAGASVPEAVSAAVARRVGP